MTMSFQAFENSPDATVTLMFGEDDGQTVVRSVILQIIIDGQHSHSAIDWLKKECSYS